jgi:hypothetical protein
LELSEASVHQTFANAALPFVFAGVQKDCIA